MTTVTVSFKGTHEKILEEIVDLGIGHRPEPKPFAWRS